MTLLSATKPAFTIGVFTSWLEDRYESSIRAGIYSAAKQAGVNVLCFAGGHVHSPIERERNRLYDLVSRKQLDGLLLLSGTLASFINPDEYQAFCDRFRPIPMVSIAVPMPGVPSVLVDNTLGMRQLVTHLIEVHGYHRIAFVRGPRTNVEANARYEVYRSVLAEHGLTPRPELEYTGTFEHSSGVEAIQILLDEHHAHFEALVAANDLMAMGALDALQARGIHTPEDIALGGFDDWEGARFVTPPLTTVRQPLPEMSARAFELLLAQLRGEPCPEQVTLPTELVVRESCGCAWQRLSFTPANEAPRPVMALSSEQRRQTLTEMKEAFDSDAEAQARRAGELLDAFVLQLTEPARDIFMPALAKAVRRTVIDGLTPGPWLEAVSALCRSSWMQQASPLAQARAESLWYAAQALLAETARRLEGHEKMESEQRARLFSRISHTLLTAIDLNEMAKVLADGLPRLGIARCYLALLASLCSETAAPGEACLLLAYDEQGRVLPDGPDRRFPAQALAPGGLLARNGWYALIVGPLFFRNETLGFIIFQMNPNEGALYEELREQISSVIQGVLLTQQRNRLQADLEKHAVELEQAYQALKDNQAKLVIAQKLASLGRLTAGIAHEINTPLAAIRAAQSGLRQLVEEYRTSIDDPQVTSADHRQIAGEMANALRVADDAAEQVAGFVRGIKSQTRDMDPSQRVFFNAAHTIQEALRLLGHAAHRANCRLVFEGEEAIELYGAPARLMQVITNLVVNAIEASAGRGGGPVRVRLARTAVGQAVELSVSDEGAGIAPDILPKIFDPLFTTKPFGESAGLGLTITHDIVTGEFGGAIEVDSAPGQGATFKLFFPRAKSS